MIEKDIRQVGFEDLLRPDVLADPYPLFRRLRQEDPVHEDPGGRGWMVARYDDIAKILADRRFSAQRTLAMREGQDTSSAVRAALARQMLFLDPPDHTRLRALVTKAFTPGLIEQMRQRVQDLTDELVDKVQGRGRMDLIRDYALPVPTTIIAEMLGVPVEDRHKFHRWSHALFVS